MKLIENKNRIEEFLLERGFKKEIVLNGELRFSDNYEKEIVIIGDTWVSFYVRFKGYEGNFGFKLNTKKFEKYFKAFCNKIMKYQEIINRYEKFQEKIKNIREKYSLTIDKIRWNPKNNRFEVKIKLASFITERIIFKEQEFILTDNGKFYFYKILVLNFQVLI